MTVRTEGTFRARIVSFGEMRALAEAFSTAAGADHDATLRVVLVLEELFTNTVTHGYAAGHEGPVWVSLATDGTAIEITYEDACPAFDPLTGLPASTRAVEEMRPGGLGLALVRGLSASARYARTGDRNRLILTVAIGQPPPPPATP